MSITYTEHKHYKYLHNGILDYLNENYEGNIVPVALIRYSAYLSERYVHDIINILDYPESKVLDADDTRYPNEQFLISIAESRVVMDFSAYLKIMELICSAWYCFGGIDYLDTDFISFFGENGYSLYTGGWSGNESIITALKDNGYITMFLNIENDKKCHAVWRISFKNICNR